MKYLKSDFDSIYVMLGSDCNANCKYCLQKGEKKNQKLPTEINEDAIDFIINMAKEYVDYQHTFPVEDRKYFWITYFGGEPLLYFDKIKYISKKVSESGVLFRSSIITNGLLLDKEKVDFLNDNYFTVALSWDGINTIKTRLFDIFSMKNRDEIFRLNSLFINSILTKYSYPMDIINGIYKLNDEYRKYHNYNLGMNIETFIDTGKCNEDQLDDMDENRLYNEIYNLTMKYLNIDLNNISPNEYIAFRYINDMVNSITTGLNNNEIITRGSCLCGWNHLNMDLQGNFYRCHNATTPIADIYSTLNRYFTQLSHIDTRTRDTGCNDCEVKHLCHGGCKMVPEELEEKYCRVQRAYYIGFYNAICDWGKEHG